MTESVPNPLPTPPSSAPQPRRSFWRRVVLRLIIYLIPIGIVAAIAIPNLLRSRISSGEDSSVGNLRTINTANVTYSSTYPRVGFAPSLKVLGGGSPCNASEETACLIDDVLARGEKSGRRHAYRGFDHDGDGIFESYNVTSTPMQYPDERRHFYTDQSGVIRFEVGKPAGPASPPLQ